MHLILAHELHLHLSNQPGPLSPWDLAAVALLLAAGTLYLLGRLELVRRGGTQRRFEPAAFVLGWLAMMSAVLPPLDALAPELFSAHMVQHELMMLVAAPLMMAGRPLAVCLWGLPERWRRPAARVLQGAPAGSTWRLLTSPVVAWALHGAAIWIWHAPPLYDAAVENEALHAVQHATFVATAALFWWGLIYGRYGRAGYGAAVFYVFTTAVHTGVLGALLTFANVPLYGVYRQPALARGIDALGDQQVAGLLMWVPAGIVLTMFGLGLFAAWLGEAERRTTS